MLEVVNGSYAKDLRPNRCRCLWDAESAEGIEEDWLHNLECKFHLFVHQLSSPMHQLRPVCYKGHFQVVIPGYAYDCHACSGNFPSYTSTEVLGEWHSRPEAMPTAFPVASNSIPFWPSESNTQQPFRSIICSKYRRLWESESAEDLKNAWIDCVKGKQASTETTYLADTIPRR